MPSNTTRRRVLLVGATGLIGRAIRSALEEDRSGAPVEIVAASRTGALRLDLEEHASFGRVLAEAGPIDHVIVAAGEATFARFEDLDEEAFALSVRSKLLGQLLLAMAALRRLPPHGSITLTSGALSHSPIPGSAPAATANGALDAFVRAIALDVPDGPRINVVSPGWITETMVAFGMDTSGGVPARTVAQLYIRALRGRLHGAVIEAGVEAQAALSA